jgi:hypothetical protein
MMNRELADYYGVAGPSGDDYERVELDEDHYSGILSQGSLMATRARAYETHPIHRGMFIVGQLFCSTIPDLPSNVVITAPVRNSALTTRERLAQHRADPQCRSCHEQLDPPGFAFEHFDGAGRFRSVEGENELPIDASGTLLGTDVDGERFESAADLGHLVVRSRQAQECFAQHWFRYANRRLELSADGCAINRVHRAFSESDFDVRELIVATTLTDTFLYLDLDLDLDPEENP